MQKSVWLASLVVCLCVLVGCGGSEGGGSADDWSWPWEQDGGGGAGEVDASVVTVKDTGGAPGRDSVEEPGSDVRPEPVCVPGESNGCFDDVTARVCVADGSGWDRSPCDGACEDGVCSACVPGTRRCADDEVPAICGDDGLSWELQEPCDGGETGRVCLEGTCTRLCEIAIKFNDYMGCEYWAVDLDNGKFEGGDASLAPYAVVVSNPHGRWNATVEVWAWDAAADEAVALETGTGGEPLDLSPLGPGQLRTFFLAGRDVDGTSQLPLAYRIKSSIPVTAYQFNPLDNVNVYSNDASLLLPTNSLGRTHYVMARETGHGPSETRSFLTVVGTQRSPTQVTVTVSADTIPSLAGVGPAIPALAAGERHTFTLNEYEVLNIEGLVTGEDLTGSRIDSTAPVAVFGGNECANTPNTNHCVDNPAYNPNDPQSLARVCEADPRRGCSSHANCEIYVTCCCDHIEQQLLPLETWGRRYLATRSRSRGNEAESWRVLASEDGTRLAMTPPGTDLPVLDAGEWFEFEHQGDFALEASAPILLGQYLHAEQAPTPGAQTGDAGTGDPAFIMGVPIEQYRQDYVVLSPNMYRDDYINIVAGADTSVMLDGRAVEERQFDAVPGTSWKVARVSVSDGVHRIWGDAEIGVVVYGFDEYVSYGYPGGLNLYDLR